ncbi:hypothetical protein MSSAC_1553 [Methanosarcina siciliae C2J]|uniref:Uncharacterized protein n=1 Tax=Methanosarcina siciliae C2J TaxID=1434118 RepID=A0A0E3PM24_9EURY|nr:hypothetical protein MSSAC_1553 [Methanosarcina siciliae C2J]
MSGGPSQKEKKQKFKRNETKERPLSCVERDKTPRKSPIFCDPEAQFGCCNSGGSARKVQLMCPGELTPDWFFRCYNKA